MREYELEKQISLAHLDPDALMALRKSGTCQFKIPEAVFDLDYPGQYFRRIRSLAVTIPCIGGPHVKARFILTLHRSIIRTSRRTRPSYVWQGPNDDRFTEPLRAGASI